MIVAGTVVERTTTTERILAITTTSTTATTLDPDAACKIALAIPEVSGPFTACTAAQYAALQPIHGPGKPNLFSACRFRSMGPACDGIPTTTVAPTPAPPPTPAPTAAQPRSFFDAPSGDGAYYPNCSAARVAGAAPIIIGQTGYRPDLDPDGDGIACE